jgi:hypothetical protein
MRMGAMIAWRYTEIRSIPAPISALDPISYPNTDGKNRSTPIIAIEKMVRKNNPFVIMISFAIRLYYYTPTHNKKELAAKVFLDVFRT